MEPEESHSLAPRLWTRRFQDAGDRRFCYLVSIVEAKRMASVLRRFSIARRSWLFCRFHCVDGVGLSNVSLGLRVPCSEIPPLSLLIKTATGGRGFFVCCRATTSSAKKTPASNGERTMTTTVNSVVSLSTVKQGMRHYKNCEVPRPMSRTACAAAP